MNQIPNIHKQQEDNILSKDKPKLYLATDNGELPPPSENWLEKIEIGTIFLARSKDTPPKNPVLECFELRWKSDDHAFAFVVANEHMTNPTDKKTVMYIDCLKLCRQYDHLVNLSKVSYDG